MPDKKFDAKKLEYYKKLLVKLQVQISGDVRQINEESNDHGNADAGHGTHIADAASDMYEKEFSMSLASNELEILKLVRQALKRVEDGTYGFCLKSGKKIPEARLKALPYAEYTLEVQEEIDAQIPPKR